MSFITRRRCVQFSGWLKNFEYMATNTRLMIKLLSMGVDEVQYWWYKGCTMAAGNPFLFFCWTDCAPGKLCYTDEKKRVPLTAVSVLDLFIRGPWADTQVVNYRPRRKINSLPMWTLSYESTNRGQPFEARLFGLDICTIRKTKMCKQMFQGFVLFWMKVSSSCSGLF